MKTKGRFNDIAHFAWLQSKGSTFECWDHLTWLEPTEVSSFFLGHILRDLFRLFCEVYSSHNTFADLLQLLAPFGFGSIISITGQAKQDMPSTHFWWGRVRFNVSLIVATYSSFTNIFYLRQVVDPQSKVGQTVARQCLEFIRIFLIILLSLLLANTHFVQKDLRQELQCSHFQLFILQLESLLYISLTDDNPSCQ